MAPTALLRAKIRRIFSLPAWLRGFVVSYVEYYRGGSKTINSSEISELIAKAVLIFACYLVEATETALRNRAWLAKIARYAGNRKTDS